MPGFEVLGFNAVELIIAVYLIAGSYSLGYLMLRTGWPKIRVLEENYRIGWSVIFGVFFTILCINATIILSAQKILPIVITITLIIALIILSMRRMLFATSKTMTVSMPKEQAAAKIIAEKSSEQLLSDKQFILNKSLSSEQVEKIKESLKAKGA
jgi:membrane glycosyltransferase